MRKIIHIDMDAFFASVEQHDRPELRGLPIAVGGAEPRGVVCAASYEARQWGVRSAMSGAAARRKCPHLTFVTPRFDRYQEVSREIHRIFHDYTDLIEPVSLDEAYLDVTENKRGFQLAIPLAEEIRGRIWQELGLTASAGVSYNKYLAKVASDVRKPNGLFSIHPDEALSFLETLPVERLWGVGRVTEAEMHRLGILTVGDLRQRSLQELTQRFGKAGRTFYDFARGIDERPVINQWIRKSLGCEHTFEADSSELLVNVERLRAVAEDLARRLERKHFAGRTLTLKIRWADFSTSTRSLTDFDVLSSAEDLHRAGVRLLEGVDFAGRSIRLLGLSLSNPPREPRPGEWVQPLIPFPEFAE